MPDHAHADSFWLRSDDTSRQLSPGQLDGWMRKWGYRLPDELTSALRRVNGGVPRLQAFAVRDTDAPRRVFRIAMLDELDRIYPVTEPGGEGLVRIGIEEDDVYWLCLDYRDCGPHGEPAVAWYLSLQDGFFSERDSRIIQLASSLQDFFDGLSRWSISDCFGIASGDTSEQTVWQAIFDALSLRSGGRDYGGALYGTHAEWESVPSATDGTTQATFDLEPNSTSDEIQFPSSPESVWLLQTNAHPRYRHAILEALRTRLTWTVSPLYIVDWTIWRDEITEPLDGFGGSLQ